MSEENKTVELKDKDLDKVAGGSGTRLQSDQACNSFVCKQCSRGLSQHKVEVYANALYVMTNIGGNNWQPEWRDNKVDCNHCIYFDCNGSAIGYCTKD